MSCARNGLAMLALGLSMLCGCSGAARPQLGNAVYEGSHIEDRSTDLGFVAIKDDNKIDPLAKSNMATDREPVLVFVAASEIGKLRWEDSQLFDQAALAQELTRAVKQAMTTYGRFECVNRPEDADIIAESRMATIAPWGDWFRDEEDLKAEYRSNNSSLFGGDSDASRSKIQDWTREGVDMVVAITLKWAKSGNEFATGEATGQLISRKGEVFEHARVNSGAGKTSSDEHNEVKNTKIREEQIPQLVSNSARGAMIVLHKKIDATLWDVPGPNKLRAKRIRKPIEPQQ